MLLADAEQAIDPRAVGAHQPARGRLAQERPGRAHTGNHRFDSVMREIAAGQRRVRGPGRRVGQIMRKPVEALLPPGADRS